MRFRILSALLVCGLCLAGITPKIDAILNDSSQSKAVYGVQIAKAECGSIVYSKNADLPLIPASNMKIFTGIAAVKILGSDYVFRTGVYLVDNDIVIKGSGDPLLGDKPTLQEKGESLGWELERIADAVEQTGIKKLDNVIVDSSVFDDLLIHPSWNLQQLNRDYSAEVCGINYNGNCVEVIPYPSGSKIAYELVPKTSYVSLNNRASFTTERKNTVWVSRVFETNNMTLFGNCYTRAVPIRVTIHRPAVFFGYILTEKLLERGIILNGSILEKHKKIDADAVMLVEFSNTLKDVLTRSNSDSFNLAAEALAKKISSAKTTNQIGGQWEHSGELIAEILKKAGVKTDNFVFDDGSGLSRNNRVTAGMTVRLLLDVFNSQQREFFIDTLAVGGVSGSSPVSSNFTEPEYKGRVFAKSGTIGGVRALSGYCQTENGQFVFSILVNNANWQSREAINGIVKAIFDN